jgi:polyribonucleotide nucleotidyltransferase
MPSKQKLAAEIAAKPEDIRAPSGGSESQGPGQYLQGITKKLMRQQIVEEKVRVDGRKLDEVRPSPVARAMCCRPESTAVGSSNGG